MNLLVGWAVNALCLLALPLLFDAVEIAGFGTALVASLVLGLLNALIRPVLIVLTLPINLLTLGLFTFVINGMLFWLAARFLEGFSVASLGWAILASAVYSLVTWTIGNMLFRPRSPR
ncbi:MAG: hypothetical protein RIS35_1889 [Pseudomonadota bacterium]|jgi:putative membrane protein